MMNRIARFTFTVILMTILAACAPGSLTPKPSSTTKPLPSPTLLPTNTALPAGLTPLPSPTLLPGYSASPAWLPAGVIAFSNVEVGEKDAIYLVHTDGTGLVLLADGPDPWNEHPTWSPDGTRIAYHSGTGNFPSFTLWAINSDGSDQVQLTHLPPGALYPAWSPDGAKIAFSANTDNGLHISLMNADGSNQTVLTSGPANIYDLFSSWAPNGTILFMRWIQRYGGTTSDVFAINPDGTGLVQLTKVGYVGGYALSPDGTKLAIHDTTNHRIEVLPIDAGGISVTLVDGDFGCVFVAISWSPDGQTLALACNDLDMVSGSDLYIVKADGSGITTVPIPGSAFDPAWRP
jgi:Tol biopolymer transport system component